MIGDPVLAAMAQELYDGLVRAGVDPGSNTPDPATAPPSAFVEYKDRGGTVYTERVEFNKSLIESVHALAGAHRSPQQMIRHTLGGGFRAT